MGTFLQTYGVTQDPETKEYMIVMQYANNGSLLSYLDQNINKLTWMDKLRRLGSIVRYMENLHNVGLVHCDLHGGNIVLDGNTNTREIKSYNVTNMLLILCSMPTFMNSMRSDLVVTELFILPNIENI